MGRVGRIGRVGRVGRIGRVGGGWWGPGPGRYWWGNGWWTLAPLAVLGGYWFGSTYYWPDSYVEVGQPYCSGPTPDGCVLRWQDVGTEEGQSVPQCVKLCPRADATPPVPKPAVTDPIPPIPAPPPAGACLVTIYSEPNFGGRSDETNDDQADLADWNNAIASMEVKSGTWDFYTAPDFKGDVMRLAPGKYPTLSAIFDKKIGSFLCLDNKGGQ